MQISYEASPNLPRYNSGMPVTFVCSVGTLAYFVAHHRDTDCEKVDHFFYDTATNSWRDDIVTRTSPYDYVERSELIDTANRLAMV